MMERKVNQDFHFGSCCRKDPDFDLNLHLVNLMSLIKLQTLTELQQTTSDYNDNSAA